MTTTNLTSASDFKDFVSSKAVTVVHFFAPWAAQCESMSTVIDELIKKSEYNNVGFGKCEAEEFPEISQEYNIAAVPTIKIFSNGKVQETVSGANASDLVTKLNKVTGTKIKESGSLEDRLKALVNKSSVMIFMKGNPQQPRCGFSRTLVGILNETRIPYDTFDILQDEEVRQGLKTYSNWPTYPQVYVKGELIGGLDIIQELNAGGELIQTLQPN